MSNATELLPGDRLPNVLVRGPDGASRALHAWHAGFARVLFVVEQPAALPDTVAALARAEASQALIVLPDAPGFPLPGFDAAALRAPPAYVRRLCGAARDWCVLLLGADFRLIDRLNDSEGLAARLVAFSAARSDAAAETVVEQAAPVLIVPAVLEPALCQDAIAYLCDTRGGGLPSGVLQLQDGNPQFVLDPSIKQRRETLLDEPELQSRVHERITRRVLPEIDRVFHFAVQQREHFKLLCYEAGAGYFRAHRDNDSRDVAHRRFAMTINLNAGEYAGGALRFPEFGTQAYSAAAGSALVFSCSVLHEVTAIRNGTRYALTTFFS